ncbi:MAG: PAS-domain containing protein [Alphaproteobacteria bacterium]|nr:PAS-domain containing protein [Alphaproteobacteria bacterium]
MERQPGSAGMMLRFLPLERAGRSGKFARRRKAVTASGAVLLAIYGACVYNWSGDTAPAIIAFAVIFVIAGGIAWFGVRTVEREQLAATQLRRHSLRLARRNSLLQSTIEHIGEGLSVFDSQGRLIAWNVRFCELLDIPPEIARGATLGDVLSLQMAHGDFGDAEPEAEVARRLDLFYRDVPITKERATAAGRVLQIRRCAMPNGAVLSVYSDVTEIRASERKLIEARSQAELASRAKGDFLANMSHELRTPLNAIIGFSEVISNELFGPIANEKYLEYIKDIHASSLHLLSIINDVLDMSKIEAGKVELAKDIVQIKHVISEVTRMIGERARGRGIELSLQLAGDDVAIWADERSVKQILLNLLANAINFSQPGSKVWVRIFNENSETAVLEIEDQGIGMNEEEQERALQPFGRAKPAMTGDYGGTGLGLPITKGLVEAHGGILSIESRAGIGTTVRIKMPREPKATMPLAR